MTQDEQIVNLMVALDLTRDEALEVIASDKEVDRMTVKEAESDLTADQKKASKNARITHCADAYGKKRKIERKADDTKGALIAVLAQALTDFGAECMEITNAERELNFAIEGRKFKVVLSAPRK